MKPSELCDLVNMADKIIVNQILLAPLENKSYLIKYKGEYLNTDKFGYYFDKRIKHMKFVKLESDTDDLTTLTLTDDWTTVF